VVAAQREHLASLYKRMGVDPKSDTMAQLVAVGNAQTSKALAKAVHRKEERYSCGLELKLARQHFKRQQLATIKLGMSENWNIKNRFRATRIRAEGIGVHG
jgi:hypothetical protein